MNRNLICIGITLCAFASSTLASPTFTATDIGNLGGTWETVGTDINDNSQIVGYSHMSGVNEATGFVWQAGNMTWNLWSGIVYGAETQSSSASAISINGTPVGTQQSFGLVNHAVYWNLSSPATAYNIQSSSNGSLCGINSSDVAVGYYWNGTTYIPISCVNGTTTNLTSGGLSSGDQPFDINDGGDICGITSNSQPFYFHNGTRTVLSLPSGWNYGTPNRLNNLGSMAGNLSGSGGVKHAFITRPELPRSATQYIRDLGTLGGTSSYAYDINDFGDAVGKSLPTGNGQYHGFVWIDGTMYDLNSSAVVTSGLPSGSTVIQATAINNKREIVAIVQVPRTGGGNDTRTYLLQPTSWW